MLIGGLMGAAIGGVVGGITGLIGADNMDKFFQGTVDLAEKAVNSVVEFFGGIVAGATSFIKGDGYNVGRNRYIAKHAGSSRERLTEIDDKQIDAWGPEGPRTLSSEHYSKVSAWALPKLAFDACAPAQNGTAMSAKSFCDCHTSAKNSFSSDAA